MRVTFFVPDVTDIEKLSAMDPDRVWRTLRSGGGWMLQTYLRLHHSGYPVEVSNTVPSDGLVVFHPIHEDILKCGLAGRKNVILVGTRADCRRPMAADFEILQNGCWSDEETRFFIPYWPQPAIIPRCRQRSSRVETISFKGHDVNVHPYYQSKDWRNWLKQNGIIWKHDSVPCQLTGKLENQANWHDYSDVDVVVAFRPAPDREKKLAPDYTNKPANKLYNAWIAGMPAVLGREYAYRELRRSSLDYIEIEKPEDAKEVILKLKTDPKLYQAMVKNGHERAKEFAVEKITRRWAEILFDLIPRQANTHRMRMLRQCPLRVKAWLRKFPHRLSGRPRW